jgi:hypothetical protein
VLISDMQFTFAELPGVLVFPDDNSPQSFYAMAATPRLARRDDGKPEISLLVRSKKIAGVSEVTGGFLTLTAVLGLSLDEETTLMGLLARKLIRESSDPDKPAPKPRVLGISWLSGNVQLALDPNITASGMPAMFGDNRCAFSVSLNAEQAKAVYKAWQQGTLELRVHYQMKAQSAPPSSSRSESFSSQAAIRTDDTIEYYSATRQESSITTSVPYEVDVQGPLELAKSELSNSLTEVSL